jgi:hypothetical protein
VLQIASGMYFPDDEVWETTHRRAYYSNAVRVQGDDISLPIGRLRFTDGSGAVQPMLIEATDRLPKRHPDGSESIHIATGGDELIDDVADVTAFVFDAIVTADPDLADRVVGGRLRGGRRPIKQLRRVTDEAHHITDDEIAKATEFCSALLALERRSFEAAMRAIRRVTDAVALSPTDVTLSYTLFVAALESLSGDTVVPQLEWDRYETQKRQLVDDATVGLPGDRVERIRGAVLGIDSMRIARRFQTFVLNRVNPEFYRHHAVGADRAMRSVDLPKALDFAYSIRSKAMHELRDLAPELWAIMGFEETIWHEGRTVLTLEGLHRLSQHVIREYVRCAPTGVDSQFQANWRDSIPGVVKVEFAPQYWLPSEPGTDAAAGPRMFGGLVESVLAAIRGEAEGVVDLAEALVRIESRLRTEPDAKTRLQLAATYALWHAFMREDFHRPNAAEVADSYMSLLSTPTIYSYVINLLGGAAREWSNDDVF